MVDLLRPLARMRLVRRVVLPLVQRFVKGGRIRRGAGKGLKIELAGGNPGVLLGLSEPPVQDFVARLGPSDVFYDVGANIGFFTLIAARNGAHAFAFEPHPVALAALKRNLAANHLAADIYGCALADRDGAGYLDAGAVHTAALAESGHPVQLRRLDGLELPPPTAVKIDVDGAEAAVLVGMRETLKAHMPRLAVELHGTLAECEAILAEIGYRWRVVDDGGMPHLFTTTVP